jgi:hypothetical protein
MGDIATEFKEFGEDDIENGEHHEWSEKGPKVAQDGALVTEFEIRLSELF